MALTPATQPLKVYVLTDALRAHYLAKSIALDPAKVDAKLPSHVQHRLNWVGGIQGTAWYDRAELALAFFGGRAVTDGDIDDLGFRIAFAREVLASAAVQANGASKHPAKLSDKALRAEVVRCETKLCDAFVTRCTVEAADGIDVAEVRTMLQEVRRATSASTLAAGCVSLFALCDAPTIVWLRALPKGEGAALDRLREVHPEWDRRLKHTSSAPTHDGAVADLPQRAVALAFEDIGRLVATGRYLIKGRAERKGDHPGYHAPKARKVADAPPVVPLAPQTPPVA